MKYLVRSKGLTCWIFVAHGRIFKFSENITICLDAMMSKKCTSWCSNWHSCDILAVTRLPVCWVRFCVRIQACWSHDLVRCARAFVSDTAILWGFWIGNRYSSACFVKSLPGQFLSILYRQLYESYLRRFYGPVTHMQFSLNSRFQLYIERFMSFFYKAMFCSQNFYGSRILIFLITWALFFLLFFNALICMSTKQVGIFHLVSLFI